MSFPLHRLCVAPMMDWTDRHYRYFMRQITHFTTLYTEMITAQAIVHGDVEKLLGFHMDEKRLVLQLGGSDPCVLGQACRIARLFDYDGINLNAGCPSERVSAGKFGASLRQDPALIKECFLSMQENTLVPVSIKTRIALEEMTLSSNGYDDLCGFVDLLSGSGCKTFIIHARKAKLKGFTPKQNRDRLPIRYDLVYQLKSDFPKLEIILNGDIKTLGSTIEHLTHVDGAMIGRAAYGSPYVFATADQDIFKDTRVIKSRTEIIESMYPYIDAELSKGVRLHNITRHFLGLFHECAGSAYFRRTLTTEGVLPNANVKTVAKALDKVISST